MSEAREIIALAANPLITQSFGGRFMNESE